MLGRATDLVRYASDASPYRLIPQAVVRPRDAADVAALLRAAASLGTPVVFRAGGTSLNGQSQTDCDPRRRPPPLAADPGPGRRARALACSPGSRSAWSTGSWPATAAASAPTRASTNIACVGGVVANNSGGMRCGVTADSYQHRRAR